MENYNEIFRVTENNWQEKIPLINRYVEIKETLKSLDEKTTRPLRAILAGKGTDGDKKVLEEIELEVQQLREELQQLLPM